MKKEFDNFTIILEHRSKDLGQFSIHNESEKAIRLGDGLQNTWIPKSIIEVEYISDNMVVFRIESWATISFFKDNSDKR